MGEVVGGTVKRLKCDPGPAGINSRDGHKRKQKSCLRKT